MKSSTKRIQLQKTKATRLRDSTDLTFVWPTAKDKREALKVKLTAQTIGTSGAKRLITKLTKYVNTATAAR